MATMTADAEYHGFLPLESDGNAKVKEEFVIMKKKIVCGPTQPHEGVSNKEKNGDAKKPFKKARGQNKNRPRTAREPASETLCPSKVNDTGVCVFGEKCKRIHDIKDYMKIKPKDLGNVCLSFRRHGVCPYSFTCRFGSDHITHTEENGYQNVVNEELKVKNPLSTSNVLARELQINLRKRKFDFSRTQLALKEIEKKRKLEPSNQDSDDTPQFEKDSTFTNNEADENKTSEKPAVNLGSVTDEDKILIRVEEKRKIDFTNKLYLAPLTTRLTGIIDPDKSQKDKAKCGNLPFRVICKRLGADVTCGEMAVSTGLLQGHTSEWALIKRHPSEDLFGVQLCGAFPDTMARCAEMIDKSCNVDFIDINMGCPIDLIYKKGAGSALMRRTHKLYDIITTVNRVSSLPLTCKLRTGIETNKNTAHNAVKMMKNNGIVLATIHGRSREARYTRIADWNYIDQCAKAANPMPVFGNGDVFSYHDYYSALENTAVSGIMIARGALIKPWIFTEIKERRDWDITSGERFGLLKDFVNEGLVHWGSDTRGIDITRRFFLEWCSFLHRYIPLGILEHIPQRINERPPYFVGRNDLETLMASPNSNDWVKLSEMLLGPVPDSFTFLPKHKANAYK